MASIVRAQIAWSPDSGLPRDAITINPHFENTGGVFTDTDWQSFAAALSTAMAAYTNAPMQTAVTIYDAQGLPPHPPLAKSVRNLGLHPASGHPREIALCLSYYSQRNAPRFRGRLYIPAPVITLSVSVRPAQVNIDKTMSMAGLLANAGGVDVDWIVYSRRDNDARPVSNFWVDNEWDTIRSRGLRGTARSTGTASE